MSNKQSSSQVAWALLMEGVSQARIDAHRLRHLVNRAMQLIDKAEDQELIYQLAGDIIMGVPKHLDKLTTDLDRTSLALSKMGVDFLESRLPLSDKNMVDDAIESAFGKIRHKGSVDRLVQRFFEVSE